MNGLERIRLLALQDKVVPVEKHQLIQDGDVIGLSGFGGAGEAKTIPLALAEYAKQYPIHITLATGASLGNRIDGKLNEANVITRRYPYQADPFTSGHQ